MRSTTSTIEALRKAVGDTLPREEFDKMISEVQADAITRTANKYGKVYSDFADPTDKYVSQSCQSVAESIRKGDYVMTVGSWGLAGTDDPKIYKNK